MPAKVRRISPRDKSDGRDGLFHAPVAAAVHRLAASVTADRRDRSHPGDMTIFAIILALATYAGLAALTARAMAARGLRPGRAGGSPPPSALLIAALGNAAIGLLVMAEQVWIGGRDLAGLGLGWSWADAGTGLAIAVITLGLAAAFARGAGDRPRPPALLALVLACGAWMEELLFRGFLLGWLHPLGVVAALLLSSLAFTLIHLPTTAVDRYKLIDWMLGGIYLGLVYLLSGSVWVATAAHLSRNLANAWLLPPRAATATGRRALSARYAVVGAAAVAVAVIAA